MQTLLWYRFQTIWKQMKVVLICMGVAVRFDWRSSCMGSRFFFLWFFCWISFHLCFHAADFCFTGGGAGKEYRFAADPATHSGTSCSGQLCFNLGLCGNHGRLCIAVNDCLAGHMGNCCSCNGHCSVGEYDLSALVCVFRQPESIDFCTAVDGFGRNWLFFYFRRMVSLLMAVSQRFGLLESLQDYYCCMVFRCC